MQIIKTIFPPLEIAVKERIERAKKQYKLGASHEYYWTLKELLELEKDDKKLPDVNFELAKYCFDNNSSKEYSGQAGVELDRAIRKLESGAKHCIPEIDYYLFRARLRHNEEDYQKVYELDSSNVEAILGLVSVKMSSDEKKIIDSGIELILEAVKDQTEQLNLLLKYAEEAEANRSYSKAIRLYEEVLKIKKEPKIYVTKANCYFLLKQFDLALKDLDQALAIDPDFHIAYLYKANILVSVNLELARELYQKINVEELENSFKPHYYHNYAIALNKLKLYPEALEKVNQAISLDSQEVDFLKTKLNILIQLGLCQEILEICDLILSFDENFIALYTTKAITCIILDRYNELPSIINKAFDLIKQKNQLNNVSLLGLPIVENKLLSSECQRWLKEDTQSILHTFLLRMYTVLSEEEATVNYIKTTIDNLIKNCENNLVGFNIGFYAALVTNLKDIQKNAVIKNQVWIDILEITLGKYLFCRDGIYLTDKAIDYWNSGNPQILDKLSESEKELIINL